MTKRVIAAALTVVLCCPASSSTTEQTAQFSAIVLGIGLGLFLIHRGQHTTPDAARSAEAAAVPPFRLSHRYYLSSFLKRMLKRMENAIDELSNRVPTYSERALYAEDDAADAADAAQLANSITNTKSGN
jgi:hypothetical protein